MPEQFDFSKIPIFLAAAEHLNFTEAARQLFITQSSLSKAIAAFEASIGFPLFERGNRKVALTPEGAYLYRELSRVMSDTQEIISTARQVRTGQAGRFCVGVSGYLPQNPIFERINSQFSIEYPDYAIELLDTPYPQMRKELIDGKVDAILFNQHDMTPMKGFFILPLMRGETILLSNPYLARPTGPAGPRLEDYHDRRFVSMNPEVSRSYYDYLMRTCKAYGFTPNIVKYTSSLAETVNYVGNTDYVTILDRSIFPVKNCDLTTLPIPRRDGMIRLDTVLAWRCDVSNQALARYIAFAEETLGQKASAI